MEEGKIQDVFHKLRERKDLLTQDETHALFAHLDSLAKRIGILEGISPRSRGTRSRGKPATAGHASKPGKKEILEEYGLLYEALKHARHTNYTDGEEHFMYLNRIAALAADAVALYEMGVAIGSPLRLNDEKDEEDESDQPAIATWSEIAHNSLLTNETLVVLSRQRPKRASSRQGQYECSF